MTNQHKSTTLDPPAIDGQPADQSKWQREYRAFSRLLPGLLGSQRDRFVAVHEEKVIDSDDDEMALIARVLSRLGNVDFHVGLVTDQAQPVHRSGVVRNPHAAETA